MPSRKSRTPSTESSSPFSFLSRLRLSSNHLREVAGVLLFLLGGLTLLTLLHITSGTVSDLWAATLRILFGWGAFALPFFAIGAGAYLLRRGETTESKIAWGRIFAAEILFTVFLALVHLLTPASSGGALAQSGEGGGFIGYALSYGLASLIGDGATFLVLLVMGVLSIPGILGLNAVQLRQWSDTLAARAESKPASAKNGVPETMVSETLPKPKPVAPFVQPTRKPLPAPVEHADEPAPVVRPAFGTKPPMKLAGTPQPILTPRGARAPAHRPITTD